jgi:hypothetical protein
VSRGLRNDDAFTERAFLDQTKCNEFRVNKDLVSEVEVSIPDFFLVLSFGADLSVVVVVVV